MITHVQGKLVEKTPTYAVIDCNGIGYFIHISLNTYSALANKETCKLFTHLAVREDAHTLYGFFEPEERKLFRHLISVSGVGAATARMILSSLSPAEIHQAIVENNVNILKGIKGIGAKSAQRIIVDLKDKLQKEDFIGGDISITAGNTKKEEALSALLALGFDRAKSNKMLEKILLKEGGDQGIEDLIKQALKQM